MKKIIYVLVPLVIITVVASVFGFRFWTTNTSAEKVSPKIGEIIEAVYGLGKVKTNKLYQIKLGVISTIQTVYVHEGDPVKEGQKLIQLDSGILFKAPFSGTVTLLSVHDGETAGTQNSILTLAGLDDRYIELILEQDGALRIKKNQIARISFESMRGQTLTGHVSALYPREDEFIANIAVENMDQSLLPGMSADVAIEIGKINGTTVPLKAIRNGHVTVERHGKTQKVKVEVGLIDGLTAEIKNNTLSADDLVLVPRE